MGINKKLRLTYKFVGLEEIGAYDDVLNVCCVWEIQGLLLFFCKYPSIWALWSLWCIFVCTRPARLEEERPSFGRRGTVNALF
jgi:hypothetical protein